MQEEREAEAYRETFDSTELTFDNVLPIIVLIVFLARFAITR